METPRKAVLLIEDDSLLVNLYALKLKQEGFEVVVAHDGEEGLKVIDDLEPCLIVLDLGLPGIGGMEVLEKVRNNPKTKDIRVIVITVSGKQEDEARAKELGVSGYVVKSEMRLDDLCEKVRACFDCK